MQAMSNNQFVTCILTVVADAGSVRLYYRADVYLLDALLLASWSLTLKDDTQLWRWCGSMYRALSSVSDSSARVLAKVSQRYYAWLRGEVREAP